MEKNLLKSTSLRGWRSNMDFWALFPINTASTYQIVTLFQFQAVPFTEEDPLNASTKAG